MDPRLRPLTAKDYVLAPEQRSAKCWGTVQLLLAMLILVLQLLRVSTGVDTPRIGITYIVISEMFTQLVSALILVLATPTKAGQGAKLYMGVGFITIILLMLHVLCFVVATWGSVWWFLVGEPTIYENVVAALSEGVNLQAVRFINIWAAVCAFLCGITTTVYFYKVCRAYAAVEATRKADVTIYPIA